MSQEPTSLVLERLNKLDRQMDALIGAIRLQSDNFNRRLEDIALRLSRMESTVQSVGGEIVTVSNAVLGAQQEVARAHRRVDELLEEAANGRG